MAAAREEGLIKFVAVNPAGGSVIIMGYKDTRQLAPTGKIAEPDKWHPLKKTNKAFNGSNGWKIQMLMKSEADDSLDNANDSIYKIPAYVNGVLTTIGKEEFQQNTGQTYASPNVTANVDSLIGEYQIPAGTNFELGGDLCWIEPYDDTA